MCEFEGYFNKYFVLGISFFGCYLILVLEIFEWFFFILSLFFVFYSFFSYCRFFIIKIRVYYLF